MTTRRRCARRTWRRKHAHRVLSDQKAVWTSSTAPSLDKNPRSDDKRQVKPRRQADTKELTVLVERRLEEQADSRATDLLAPMAVLAP